MTDRKTTAEILDAFMKTVRISLIDLLKKNQEAFAYQRELRESPRFKEAQDKIKAYADEHTKLRDDFYVRENVIEVIRKFLQAQEANRMTQFLEKSQSLSLKESDALKLALAPYLCMVDPVESIRKLQTTLMNQGKIKKMPLPYDEITKSLNETAAVAAKIPATLIDDVCGHTEHLEQVA